MNTRHKLKTWLWAIALAVWLWLGSSYAFALSGGGSLVGVAKFGDTAIRNFAAEINERLDQDKVNVAIIARSGRLRRDMPEGINYTHTAVVVFEPVRLPDGKVSHTYTVYNLYQGGPGAEDTSYLKTDFVYDFVAGVAEPDIALCVPSDALQRRLIGVIRSPAYRGLYNPRYNLLANPWVDQFDNCVTHTLKLCVAAIYQTHDRARIYENIRRYFKPTPVHLGPFQSIGSFFMTAVSHEDEDESGLQTATFDSLQAFLADNGLVKERLTLRVRP